MKAIRVAMIHGIISLPSLPVTKNDPSTMSATAAHGRVSSVSRRRPTRSMMASPMSCATR